MLELTICVVLMVRAGSCNILEIVFRVMFTYMIRSLVFVFWPIVLLTTYTMTNDTRVYLV